MRKFINSAAGGPPNSVENSIGTSDLSLHVPGFRSLVEVSNI